MNCDVGNGIALGHASELCNDILVAHIAPVAAFYLRQSRKIATPLIRDRLGMLEPGFVKALNIVQVTPEMCPDCSISSRKFSCIVIAITSHWGPAEERGRVRRPFLEALSEYGPSLSSD